MLTLIRTYKLNNVDSQAWLADVLERIADHKSADLAALLLGTEAARLVSSTPPNLQVAIPAVLNGYLQSNWVLPLATCNYLSALIIAVAASGDGALALVTLLKTNNGMVGSVCGFCFRDSAV
jgi:hypothetical protein